MRRRGSTFGVVGLLVLAMAASAMAAEPTPGVVEEILDILRERGIVDEGEYTRILGRYAATEKKRGWLDKLSFSGDFRTRFEGFWFDEDRTGVDRDNRFRGRYRLRLGAKAAINEYATLHVRLASGQDDIRSTNVSFGQDDEDFDPDEIFIDRAFVELAPPSSWVPMEGGKARLHIGKMNNPFLWKVGKDFMLWDGDITPEGVALRLKARPGRDFSWFANAGYFIIEENSTARDPHLFAAQLGGELAMNETVAVGTRVTWYEFRSLNEDFVCRGVTGTNINSATGLCDGGGGRSATSSRGNILDGLTGAPSGENGFDVGELGAYLKWTGSESWPVTLYGNVATNFDAEDSDLFPAAEQEDLAYGIGIEVGDKKELAKLGFGWWHVEANAFPSQFTDSDLFDGVTNREGFALHGSRQVLKSTDLNVAVFYSDDIDSDLPAFMDSVGNAERWRLQTDLVFKF